MYPTGKLEFQGGYSDRGFGANDFYTPAYPDQYERIKTTFASVKATSEGTLHLTPSFYWRRNQDRFELFRDFVGAPSWYVKHNYHLTDTYGSNLSSWINTGFGKLAFGTDFRSENIWSTVLGKEMSVPTNAPGEKGIQFNHADSRTNLSLFGEYSHHLGPIDISGGLMANWNSSLGRKWQLYPGFDLGWKMLKPLKLYLSVNKSLRMPNVYRSLLQKCNQRIGNSEPFKPEEALSLRDRFKIQQQLDNYPRCLFLERWGKNIIDWVRQPNETLWYAKNLTDLNTRGIEVSAKINPSLSIWQGDFYPLTGSLIRLSDPGQRHPGLLFPKYLLDYLKHKIDIRPHTRHLQKFECQLADLLPGSEWNLYFMGRKQVRKRGGLCTGMAGRFPHKLGQKSV